MAKSNAPSGPSDRKALSERRSIDAFLAEADKTQLPTSRATHRLVFALDATASRQPTWDLAAETHDSLFAEAEKLGNVAIQLCYYRGVNEFHASPWTTTPRTLRDAMQRVACMGGRTQFTRLLRHVDDEAKAHRLRGLIFIGDCFEEQPAEAIAAAGQLAIRGVPVFIFQEGRDPTATSVFSEVAGITRGARVPLDASSAATLRQLLGAVVSYAVGGRPALEQMRTPGATRLLENLSP